MKSEILKLRKKIYKNLKEKAFSYEVHNPEIQKYQKDQSLYTSKPFQLSTMEQLASQVLDSNLIYLGDFHTFDQNIRNVLRIVKMIIDNDDHCILGLEMINSEHQLYIDAYLERHLTDLEFLDLINYGHSWRFPWSHYRLLFDLAKKYDLKIIGLNKTGSLGERDRYAASLLTKTIIEHSSAKIVVLYGELHIVKNKIPKLMAHFYPDTKGLIVHQNLDQIYWKLIKSDREQGIVKFSEDEYCIISAPPWIKYESMIYWYENLIDDPEFDIHEYIIETGAKTFTEDTNENFLNIILELISHLDLPIKKEDIEDFNLYDHSSLDYVEEQLEANLNTGQLKFYRHLILSNQSFRFPNKSTFYCSSYSMNRISYLAGIHILHYFLRQNHIDTAEILSSKSPSKKFFLFCFEAIFAYFFSKIINPHRKCDMYQDIKQGQRKADYLALSILNDKDRVPKLLRGNKMKDYHRAAHTVGHILGEYLYRKANSKTNYRKINLVINNISEAQFTRIKRELLGDESYQEHSKRYF